MVFCFIAFGVFGFLGIFSAKYRAYFKEALHCMRQNAMLKPCTTGFDTKMKMKVAGKLMRFNQPLGRITYKYFSLISWMLLIAMIVSSAYSAYAVYNLATFGTCDPHGTDCVFNPGVLACGSEHCLTEGCECKSIGCTEPLHEACDGDCDCIEGTCG